MVTGWRCEGGSGRVWQEDRWKRDRRISPEWNDLRGPSEKSAMPNHGRCQSYNGSGVAGFRNGSVRQRMGSGKQGGHFSHTSAAREDQRDLRSARRQTGEEGTSLTMPTGKVSSVLQAPPREEDWTTSGLCDSGCFPLPEKETMIHEIFFIR